MSTLPIPGEVLAQHVAILGKTRSGKSSAMRLLVEDLLERKQPVCIVDPKGDWYGIKLAADGKGPGYPVVIFGGEHADVPISETNGAQVAELFATGNRPCLIDLGGWMVGPRTRFWIDFASTLFKLTKGQRWLAVDEFHNFAPKGKIQDPDAGKMLHWANRLASEGLGKGLALVFASQRPQKVHNDSLTSAETLIAMRVIHPSDRAAVSDWIKGCGDSEGSQVLNSLAQMDRGEGWAWSPEIGFGPKRVKFPMFHTYDSFRPQTVADTARLTGWAEVDLADVSRKFSAAIEKAKADDPKELRRRIAELERTLKQPAAAAPARTEVKVKEVPVLKDGQVARMEKLVERLQAAGDAMSSRATETEVLGREILTALRSVDGNNSGHNYSRNIPQPTASRTATTPSVKAPSRNIPAPSSLHRGGKSTTQPSGDLTGPEQRILDAIAWFESISIHEPELAAVAFLAGYSVSGGAFNNPRGSLRGKGLIEYRGDRLVLTDAGRSLARIPEGDLTAQQLQARVLARLPGPEQKLLTALLQAYPDSLANEELAARSGYAPEGGAFNNPKGRLRSLGLIEYPEKGRAVARPLLFLER